MLIWDRWIRNTETEESWKIEAKLSKYLYLANWKIQCLGNSAGALFGMVGTFCLFKVGDLRPTSGMFKGHGWVITWWGLFLPTMLEGVLRLIYKESGTVRISRTTHLTVVIWLNKRRPQDNVERYMSCKRQTSSKLGWPFDILRYFIKNIWPYWLSCRSRKNKVC